MKCSMRRSGACGVLRVNTIAELFDMAEVLAKQPRPQGPRLAIVTNAGGPGVLATDALISTGGTDCADFPTKRWRHSIDCCRRTGATAIPSTSSATPAPERYAKAVEIAAQRPEQRRHAGDPHAAGHDRPDCDRRTTQAASRSSKANPSWRVGWAATMSRAGEEILNRAGIPTFAYPDTAARAFNYMWRYSYNLRALYETPVLAARLRCECTPERRHVDQIIRRAAGEGRTILTEIESKQILAAYGIPVVETRLASNRGGSRRSRRRALDSPWCSSSTPRRSRTRPTSAACS